MNKTPLITQPILLFALAFSLLLIGLQTVQPILLYQREAILAGEVWRLWSGNLVHTNYHHLWLNLAGFWVLLLLCGPALSLKLLISSIFLAATAIGSAMLAWHPDIHWYAGLSGVLYGLFVVGAVCLAVTGELLSFIVMLGLIVFKLGSSWLGETDTMTESMIGARIVDEAHLYGAAAGSIIAVGWFAYRYWYNTQNQTTT